MGQLIREDVNSMTNDEMTRTLVYEYDAAGNKVAVYTGMLGDSLDGAAKTTCEYNRFGKVVKMVDPRSNALPADDPLYLVETCVYDAVGRLVSKTDRNKNTTVYAYDLSLIHIWGKRSSAGIGTS